MLSDEILKLTLKKLNLAEDEEFGVKNDGDTYRINKSGIEIKLNGWEHERGYTLDDLLLGRIKVIKLSFIPKLNQLYYCPNILADCLYATSINYNTESLKHRIKYDLCFETEQEAVAKTKEILRLLNKGGE